MECAEKHPISDKIPPTSHHTPSTRYNENTAFLHTFSLFPQVIIKSAGKHDVQGAQIRASLPSQPEIYDDDRTCFREIAAPEIGGMKTKEPTSNV